MLDYEFWIADYVAAERSSAKEIVVSELALKKSKVSFTNTNKGIGKVNFATTNMG